MESDATRPLAGAGFHSQIAAGPYQPRIVYAKETRVIARAIATPDANAQETTS